jgi:hypothetical protein
MKSTSPNDLLKSESQAASHHSTQQLKTAPEKFSDKRPEAIRQKKMQEAANASTQVMQGQALQAMANRAQQASPQNVAQLIKGDREITNTYSEVRVSDRENTDVEGLRTSKKTLVEEEFEGEDVRSTSETGYQVLELEEGEKKTDWLIIDSILEWRDQKLCTRNNFSLPVSCIEAAEHVIHHHAKGHDEIPDYNRENKKNVGLFFGKVTKENSKQGKRKREVTTNKQAAKLDSRDLSKVGVKWKDYDFASQPARLGEGLFVQSLDDRSVFHAVAVVGKKGNRIIVLERNAGETSGDNIYLDRKWLVNVYDNESSFKDSLESDGGRWRIGKLKAL